MPIVPLSASATIKSEIPMPRRSAATTATGACPRSGIMVGNCKVPSKETNRLVGMKVCHSRQRLDPSLHHEAGLASGAGSDGKIYGIGCSTTGSRINNGHDRTAGGCDVAGDDLRGEEIWVLNERLSALTVPLNLRAGRKVAAADREDKSKAAGERTGGTQGGNSGARGRQCKCKCVRSSPAWSGVDDCDRNSSRSVIKIEVCRINIRGQLRSANKRGGARGIVP